MAEYTESNFSKISAYKKNWSRSNRHRLNLQQKQRLKTDVNFRLALNLRNRINKLFRYSKRPGSHVRDLGCSIEELRLYIESKFLPGMTWENYGKKGWHLDHIIPLSRFNLTDREQFLKATHFTNLQPLWALDNIKKYNRI